MHLKTKLHIHHDIYKECFRAYNLDSKSARETFFSNIIKTHTNNAKTLFATVDRLTNPPTQIPPELHSMQKCNEFATFIQIKLKASDTPSITPLQTKMLDYHPIQAKVT